MKKAIFKTFSPKKEDIKNEWVIIDVKGKTLGRIATKIADILRGKNKPSFTSHLPCGDYVVVLNAAEIKLTGKKLTDKKYFRHSRYPNGLKETNPKTLLETKPEEVIRHAVLGMIPNNQHKKILDKRLKICSGNEHNFAAQNPRLLEL